MNGESVYFITPHTESQSNTVNLQDEVRISLFKFVLSHVNNEGACPTDGTCWLVNELVGQLLGQISDNRV